MKRLAYLSLLVISLLTSACTKEMTSIADTTWTGAEPNAIYKLTFSTNEFTFSEEVSNDMFYGDYVYESPKVTMVAKGRIDPNGKEWTGGGILIGRVKGKTMTITVNSSSVTLIKK